MIRPIKVLGMGSPLMDMIIEVNDEFVSTYLGEKGGVVHWSWAELADFLKKFPPDCRAIPGGAAGNTVYALAKLGMASALLGVIGPDEFGAEYLLSMRDADVDCRYIFSSAQTATGRCLSFVTKDNERTMRSFLGASLEIGVNEVEKVDFSQVEVLYIEGYQLHSAGVFAAALEAARQNRTKVALDLASFEVVRRYKNELHQLIKDKKISMVFANYDEAEAFWGRIDFEQELKDLSPELEVLVVKQGKDGALIRQNGRIYPVAALDVKVKDTTGAGDLWAAGFLYGYLSGFPAENSGNLAAHTAAEVVKVIGTKLAAERWIYLKNMAKHLK